MLPFLTDIPKGVNASKNDCSREAVVFSASEQFICSLLPSFRDSARPFSPFLFPIFDLEITPRFLLLPTPVGAWRARERSEGIKTRTYIREREGIISAKFHAAPLSFFQVCFRIPIE